MDELYLALDFGGTKLSVALFEIANLTQGRQDARAQEEDNLASSRLGVFALSSRRRVFTPDGTDAAHELAAMLALARELLDGRAPAAVGVSFGGPVDYEAGVVRLSHHVRGWEGMPLRDALERELGAPAAVDNDANVAALGEHRFGAGRDVDDLMYITVSTGVGGGWVLGGRAWRGHEGLAGEIGHTVVDPAGPLCLCGKRGCVERLASGPYMAADYVARGGKEEQGSRGAEEQGGEDHGRQTTDHRLRDIRGPSSADRSPHVRRPLTGRDVAEMAAAGDPLATEILLRGAWALGVGIGNAANLINPQRFILGGGVTKSGPAWWAEVRQSAAATALPEVRFDVVPSELGDDAPLWGALALAADR
jgi:glucokinase